MLLKGGVLSNNFMSQKVFKIAAIAWIITILILSVISPPSLPTNEWLGVDKIAHFASYFLLTFLILGGWEKTSIFNRKKYALVIALVSMYGIGIEFIQGFLPNRYFEVPDIIANIMGSFVGAVFYPLIFFFVKR